MSRLLVNFLVSIALLGCAAALPSAPLHLRAPQQQPLRLKGGAWLNEAQTINTVSALVGGSGVGMILLPKETLEVYGVQTQTQPERNSMQWFGSGLIATSLTLLAQSQGMSIQQAAGVTLAWSALFMLWQCFATEGLVDLNKLDRKPFYPWIAGMTVTSVLLLTDGAGTNLNLDNVVKFWAVLFTLHHIFVYFFYDTFMKQYGIKQWTRLMLTLGQSGSVFGLGTSFYWWLASDGATQTKALLPLMTLAGAYFAKQVATQEWRKVNAMHGVGPAFWMIVDSLLGYNLCLLSRGK